jgi:hypothetical protein
VGQYGQITFADLGDDGDQGKTETSFLDAWFNVSTLTGYFTKTTITLNTQFWNLGYAGENTLTILHELGHAINYLSQNGSNQIEQRDSNNPAVNKRNSDKIFDNCIKPLFYP